MLTTLTDRKLHRDFNLNDTADCYLPDTTSFHDYYPYGMEKPGRGSNPTGYRFGFNGVEADNVSSINGFKNYGHRFYYPRISRFISSDPITSYYSHLSPYQFASNTPIWAFDIDGLEAYYAPFKSYDVMSQKDYQRFVYKTTLQLFDQYKLSNDQFDCADFAITILAMYYRERKVRLRISIDQKVIDSEDPIFTGKSAWDNYLEKLKANVYSQNIGTLGIQVEDAQMQMGDYNVMKAPEHVQVFIGMENGLYKMMQASGAYHGRNHSGNILDPLVVYRYETPYGQGFRFNAINELPVEFNFNPLQSLDISTLFESANPSNASFSGGEGMSIGTNRSESLPSSIGGSGMGQKHFSDIESDEL